MSVMSIKGKRVIMTGGSRGLGESIVKVLVAEGAKVASLDRSPETGQKVVDEANDRGNGEAIFIRCDVGDKKQVDAAFKRAVEFLGGLDALVNNAAIHGAVVPAEELTEQEYDRIMTINSKGTFLTNQAAYPHLVKAGGGSIVNFSSKAGVTGEAYGSPYSMSKAGVFGWTRSIALEWGNQNIRANSLCPFIMSPLVNETRAQFGELAKRRTLNLPHPFIPLGGGFGESETDLAPVVVFLVSDASRFITGQIFSVGGGEFFTR